MSATKDIFGSVDVMNIIDTTKPERILLLDPREYAGPEIRKLVARTSVEITFDSEERLQACVRALKESDEELAKRPESMKLWDWSKTYRQGMTIVFGVNWYDRKFFEERKSAYKTPRHTAIFQKFGATPDEFKVVHEVFEEVAG